MSIFDYLKKRNASANVAKERLQIIISHERAQQKTPDYLPKLQEEIIEVISKYVPISREQVMVNLDRMTDNSAVLELNITMPEEALTQTPEPTKAAAPKAKQTNHNKAKRKHKPHHKNKVKQEA